MRTFIIMTWILLSSIFSFPSHAHKVNLIAYLQGDTCFVEGYDSASHKAEDALIEVFDLEGHKLLQGRSDARGDFSFKIPHRKGIKITMTTKTGHKETTLLSTDAIKQSTLQDHKTGVHTTPVDVHPHHTMGQETEDQEMVHMEMRKLKEIINHSLDEKLRPLIAQIALLQQKESPPIGRIAAGIGYIFGIFGSAMFIASRKHKK